MSPEEEEEEDDEDKEAIRNASWNPITNASNTAPEKDAVKVM